MALNLALEQKQSILLSSEENQNVFRLFGPRCQSLSTTVIQLYETQAPDHSRWFKIDTGVLCFVKDNVRKSYFLRLFCMRREALIWEQELYKDMEYIASTNFLHTFEGDGCMVAFNFASETEAKDLKVVLDQKIQAYKRKDEKRSSRNLNNFVDQNYMLPSSHDFTGIKNKSMDVAKRAKRKRNITKADIGNPQEFRHISHVGWDPYKGFDIDGDDEDLRKFFAKAGVSDKQLQDEETRQFIYDFINKHGGQEAVQANISEVSTTPAVVPPVPPRAPARPPHNRVAPPPPPPPVQVKTIKQPPPPLEVKYCPQVPPPPPDFTPPPPPFPPPEKVIQRADAPPPPPLPPPMDMATTQFVSPTEAVNENVNKKVDDRRVIDDARGAWLNEIVNKNFQLKPVNEREIKHAVTPVEQSGDLAGALARALAERSRAIHSEDDSCSNSDSNDDEWEE